MKILSGGAAAAVVQGVEAEFEAASGSKVDGTFSAVGMMRDKVLAGTPCDLVILTPPLIAQLISLGHVVDGSARSIGLVKTGVAVRSGRSYGLTSFLRVSVGTAETMERVAVALAARGGDHAGR